MSIGKADALYERGFDLRERGDEDGAIGLYREAARLGHVDAQISLALLLTDRGPVDVAEGMRWLRRAARAGDPTAAWNLAMQYRIGGNRRRYFHWLASSARLGDEQAKVFLRVIANIRRRGGRAPMLFLAEVDAFYVNLALQDFLRDDIDADKVREWATLVARGEAALGPPKSRSVAQAVEEMADAGKSLTRKRAKELAFSLA